MSNARLPPTNNTPRVEALDPPPYYVALKVGAKWSILEKDLSLSAATARQSVLHTANPANTYGVFHYSHSANGVTVIQDA